MSRQSQIFQSSSIIEFYSSESESESMTTVSAESVECCICYEIIGEKNNCVTECGPKFCFKCLHLFSFQTPFIGV
jgi:hypothetical protein